MIGKTIFRYKILEKIGESGLGVVLKDQLFGHDADKYGFSITKFRR